MMRQALGKEDDVGIEGTIIQHFQSTFKSSFPFAYDIEQVMGHMKLRLNEEMNGKQASLICTQLI